MTKHEMAPRSSTIRVGLIGAGSWANHGHLRVLDLLPDYHVVAVHSRRREAAEEAATRFAIPSIHGSEAALVADNDVDLVAVLNTAPQHADTVRLAIAAGKDVYCEWPLTLDTATAQALADAADRAGVRHVVGLQRRLAPHNRRLRDLIRDGYVGRLRSVRLHVSMNYFQAHRPLALAWTAPPGNFSGVIPIYAGHFLDMLFEAVGWPSRLSALQVNQFPVVTIVETGETIATTNPDQLVMAANLPGDAVASVHIEGGKRNGSGVQIDISGDAGDIRITNTSAFGGVGDDYVLLGAHGDDVPLTPLTLPSGYDWLPPSDLPTAVLELANLYCAFAQDRTRRRTVAPSFHDAVRLHRLFDSLDLSSREGRSVDPDC